MNNPSTNIFLIGMMGSGKSYWGKAIADIIGYKFMDMDELLIQDEGKSINEIFEEKGEQYFRNKETDILNQSFSWEDNFVMATGGGLPCFNNNMEALNNHGITIWLNEPVDILCSRLLKEKDHRPLLKYLTDEGLMTFIENKLIERAPYYSHAKFTLTAKDLTETFIKQLIQ